jgi:hypothetical protein
MKRLNHLVRHGLNHPMAALLLSAGCAAIVATAPAARAQADAGPLLTAPSNVERTTQTMQDVWVAPVCEERPVQVWCDAVYRTVTDTVWAAPVYRTQIENCWHEAVYRTVCEQVWVPEQWIEREVVHVDSCGCQYITHERVQVCAGHYQARERQELVSAGYFESRPHQVCVSEGHYDHVQRQELVTPGHFETRTQSVEVQPGHWEHRVVITTSAS